MKYNENDHFISCYVKDRMLYISVDIRKLHPEFENFIRNRRGWTQTRDGEYKFDRAFETNVTDDDWVLFAGEFISEQGFSWTSAPSVTAGFSLIYFNIVDYKKPE